MIDKLIGLVSLMNKIVSKANGDKMPVYDKNYFEGIYNNASIYQNAGEETKLPWLADWIRFDLDSKTKIFIGKIINAQTVDKEEYSVSTWFLSPGDIIVSVSCKIFQISVVLFLCFCIAIIFLFITGKDFIFEKENSQT